MRSLIVMYNNRAYYNDWEHQIRMARLRGTDLEKAHIGMDLFGPEPDFGALARSMGVWGEGPVEDPKDVRGALTRALEVVKKRQARAGGHDHAPPVRRGALTLCQGSGRTSGRSRERARGCNLAARTPPSSSASSCRRRPLGCARSLAMTAPATARTPAAG